MDIGKKDMGVINLRNNVKVGDMPGEKLEVLVHPDGNKKLGSISPARDPEPHAIFPVAEAEGKTRRWKRRQRDVG